MPFQFRKEAIEEDLNSNFPSQGQGNPPLYYSLSEVVVPTYSINQAAEGSNLPQNLQTAWDFSTGLDVVFNTTSTTITNTGFWQIDLLAYLYPSANVTANVFIDSGVTTKTIWDGGVPTNFAATSIATSEQTFIVYLRSGDSLKATTNNQASLNIWYRQVADLNGNLVNPLGFSFA